MNSKLRPSIVFLACIAVSFSFLGCSDEEVARPDKDPPVVQAPPRSDGPIIEVFDGIKHWPGYPEDFEVRKPNGTTKNNVNNGPLLAQLREVQPGKWKKVYKDGTSNGNKISLHFFESQSGKVFNPKIKPGWSN